MNHTRLFAVSPWSVPFCVTERLTHVLSFRESGLEEDWNMDCEEEVENRKKFEEQRRRLQKMRDLEKNTCMPQDFHSRLKEEWQQQLQEIEQKRHDLLPEHLRVQKRSQKIQRIQDKKRNMLKETVAAEEEMRKVREEINKREGRFHQLSRQVDSNRMATAELEAELRGLQAEEERRGSNASQVVVDCCLDTVAEQLFTIISSKFCTKRSSKDLKPLPLLRKCQEKKKERKMQKSKSKGQPTNKWVHLRQVGAMKAFQRVLCLILLGFGVQLVKVEDQEISMHRTIEKDLFPALRAESGGRWKKMESCEFCEWRLEERGFRQEKERKNSQENSQGRDPSTFEGRGHKAERWASSEKMEEREVEEEEEKEKKKEGEAQKKEMVETSAKRSS